MVKGQFSIDGTTYNAKNIKQTNESLASANSGRTDDGIMHIDWVRRNIRKWEIELPPCTSDELYSVFSKVQGRQYAITIFDITTNSFNTVIVYTSNSNGDCYNGVVSNGIFQGAAFSAIEV